jgi:hypothetical protein
MATRTFLRMKILGKCLVKNETDMSVEAPLRAAHWFGPATDRRLPNQGKMARAAVVSKAVNV